MKSKHVDFGASIEVYPWFDIGDKVVVIYFQERVSGIVVEHLGYVDGLGYEWTIHDMNDWRPIQKVRVKFDGWYDSLPATELTLAD